MGDRRRDVKYCYSVRGECLCIEKRGENLMNGLTEKQARSCRRRLMIYSREVFITSMMNLIWGW